MGGYGFELKICHQENYTTEIHFARHHKTVMRLDDTLLSKKNTISVAFKVNMGRKTSGHALAFSLQTANFFNIELLNRKI